jgi:glucokinase
VAVTIGVDVGGTKMAAGVLSEAGRLVDECRRETPADDAAATEQAIVDLVQDLRRRHEVEAVGIGAAGYVDADRSTVLFAPNLAWRDAPLRDSIESRVQIPVVVENDANAAAWGEFRFGAGADVDDLLMVAVGTGVGGGIIIKDKLLRGSFGVAAEIGHFRVVPQGLPCPCGQHGCWEQYASGTALVREARRRVAAGDSGAKPLLDAVGGAPEQIKGQAITTSAQQHDPFCMDLLADLGTWLGEGIASLTSILDSGVVVIGGGVSEAGELLLGPARQAFTSALPAAEHRPHLELRLAALGNEAAMIGVADLARSAA